MKTPEMPSRLSHSQVMSYATCGEQYRLERRHHLGGSISWALVGGKAYHSWTEAYDRGVPVDPADFVQFLSNQLAEDLASSRNPAKLPGDVKATGRASKEWPDKRDRKWWEHHGPIFCQLYIDWRESDDNGLMPKESVAGKDFAIEMKVEGTLGGIDTLGFIDRLVLDSPLGEPLVLDLKTGKEPGTIVQLATYAVLASRKLGIEITKGAFFLAEKGELSNIYDLSRMNYEYIEGLYEQSKRGIQNGVFLPNPNAFCSTCSVRSFCGLYGGRPPLDVPIVEGVID